MNRTIRTYNDLLQEKQRLNALLKAQKELVRQDVQSIRQELVPVQKAIEWVGRLTTRDRNNILLTGASDFLVDVIVKKGLLARASWITRIAIPFIAKNLSSHLLAGYKDVLLAKLASWLSKNGTDTADAKSGNGPADQPFAENKKEDQDSLY